MSSQPFIKQLRSPPNTNIWSSSLPHIQCAKLKANLIVKQSPAFSFRAKSCQQRLKHNESFSVRLSKAFRGTKSRLYLVSLGLGIGFFGLAQANRYHEKNTSWEINSSTHFSDDEHIDDLAQNFKKKENIGPRGPWQVRVMSTLPLKAMSRLWGKFNEFEIPYYLRVPGFKLYSYIFSVNLAEISEPDLHAYPNLASFFYRKLKPGARPIDTNPNALLSPADGRVLQFGFIESGEVEQVKGITYSLEALLGSTTKSEPTTRFSDASKSVSPEIGNRKGEEDIIQQDEEFAKVNGISYTLSNLFSGSKKQLVKITEDASTTPKAASEAEVRADLALGERSWYSKPNSRNQTALYYVVVYLAPGDYHRFHSPCAWVVESRRHFAGELYSVSPYLQRILPGLFTLNERVVLLGRWRCGFFSYIAVGATNVGSIKINFDRELKTNSSITDTAAKKAAEEAAKRNEPYCGYSEATYEAASPILRGHSLRRGEEMGGFQLGSTIVLVFEAAKGERPSLDEGWMGEIIRRRGAWKWAIKQGQKVKVGQTLGWLDES